MFFVVDEMPQVVALAEAVDLLFLVLVDTLFKIASHTRIERGAGFVGEQVNVVGLGRAGTLTFLEIPAFAGMTVRQGLIPRVLRTKGLT